MNKKIKVLIADDHKIFREGIVSILQDVEDVEIVAQASDGREALQLLETIKADLILMDISMGDFSGLKATRLIKEKYPEIKVLVLSMHSEIQYIQELLEAGASGYLLKDGGTKELLNAIHTVAGGDTYYSREVSSALVAYFTRGNQAAQDIKAIPLTPREKEVLRLIAEEYSNQEIAARLFISIRTVDTHKRNLLEKLQLKNTAGLVKYAIKMGLVE